MKAERDPDFWKIVIAGILTLITIVFMYIFGALNTIRSELRVIKEQSGTTALSVDWYGGITTKNQDKMLDLLRSRELTLDDLEKLREEVLSK